ncbi:MAG: alpha/beta fold hydrolase [Chloroflexota bacterium]
MFIDVEGYKALALSFGNGSRNFLAIGGWIGSSEVWLPTLEILSTTWRVASFDHRGAGETVVPVEAITYSALVDDVFRAMDSLRIERCVLGGESAGTQVVLDAVLRHPERFTGAVLADGAAGLPRSQAAGPSPITGPPSTWPGDDDRARLSWFVDLCIPEPDADHFRRWGLDILRRADPEAATRLWGIGRDSASQLVTRLAEVRVPVLLIRGSEDALVPRAAMEELSERLPNSKLVEVPGAGHVPVLTRPAVVSREIETHFPTD